MATKVKLKFINNKAPPSNSKVTEIAFGKLNIPFTRLYTLNDGFKAICRNSNDADVILSAKGSKEFEKIGLQVIMPPEVRAQRSVFIRQLDKQFGEHTPDQIKQEIEFHNEWIKIDEVVKIKDYHHVIKIRFTDTAITDKVISNGFLGFNMSVQPDQIKREKFVNLLTCFCCYEFQSHTTNDCPQKNTILCSECAEIGHTYRECQNPNKKCVNCFRKGYQNYNHRCLAMACPYKKKLIQEKTEVEEKKEEDRKNTTYANIAKQAVQQAQVQPKPHTNIVLGDQKDYKILICILHAHVINLANPGSYETELNKMLQINGMEQMNFPSNPPSSALLQATPDPSQAPEIVPHYSSMTDLAIHTNKQTPTDEATTLDTSVDDIFQVNMEMDITQIPEENQRHSLGTGTVKKTTRKPPKTTGKKIPELPEELGMRLYYSEKYHPSKYDNRDQLVRDLSDGKVKFTYTNIEHSLGMVVNYLEKKLLKIRKHNFYKIPDIDFQKIKNGPAPICHSPPVTQSQSKKLKKHDG